MTLHKHGNSWCLCSFGGAAPTKKERALVDSFKPVDGDRPINLHYHNGLPCTSRLCRKRGTPKVAWRDAFFVLATSQYKFTPLNRCPRCKLHLERGEHADAHRTKDCAAGSPNNIEHWCCPARYDAETDQLWAACEWHYVASAKELKDDAIVDAVLLAYPAGGWRLWTEVLEVYLRHNSDRFVPPKVFYAKLKRLEKAERIHGCFHSSASTSCRGNLHLPEECDGGC